MISFQHSIICSCIFNWYALPNLVVKADYSTRQIGTSKVFGTGKYNSENEFSIGIAYVGWFIKK